MVGSVVLLYLPKLQSAAHHWECYLSTISALVLWQCTLPRHMVLVCSKHRHYMEAKPPISKTQTPPCRLFWWEIICLIHVEEEGRSHTFCLALLWGSTATYGVLCVDYKCDGSHWWLIKLAVICKFTFTSSESRCFSYSCLACMSWVFQEMCTNQFSRALFLSICFLLNLTHIHSFIFIFLQLDICSSSWINLHIL